ncbi:hypothetical protein D3C87_1368910 [compost metagenome]
MKLVSFLIEGCSIISAKKNEDILSRAVPIGTEYFKDKYNVDVFFDRHQINSAYINDEVVLYGQFKAIRQYDVSVAISYKTFKVTRSSGPV